MTNWRDGCDETLYGDQYSRGGDGPPIAQCGKTPTYHTLEGLRCADHGVSFNPQKVKGFERRCNENAEVQAVLHSQLEPIGDPNIFKVQCPVCQMVVPAQRDQDFNLREDAQCRWCAQKFRYVDIAQMREKHRW